MTLEQSDIERIAQIKERLEKATPGEYLASPGDDPFSHHEVTWGHDQYGMSTGHAALYGDNILAMRDLITHSSNDIGFLLDLLSRIETGEDRSSDINAVAISLAGVKPETWNSGSGSGTNASYLRRAERVIEILEARGWRRTGEDRASEREEWRCFFCGEVFTDREDAAHHFGTDTLDEPGCKLNVQEGGILALYREAQIELAKYREEDNAAFREFYRIGAEHAVAMQREEEKGYARGLADAHRYPAEGGSPEDRASEVEDRPTAGEEALRHDWVPSRLGHGETMCRRCHVTNREAAALGILDSCEV